MSPSQHSRRHNMLENKRKLTRTPTIANGTSVSGDANPLNLLWLRHGKTKKLENDVRLSLKINSLKMNMT